ncbi:MAG: hypothetical protein ABH950_01460 [Candidatus Altiarchaeota archaeon]
MNETLVREGGRMVGEAAVRRAPTWWREDLFGIIPMPIVWNVFIVVIVALIFWWLLRSSNRHTETPLQLLQKRYVAGEIDRETYLQMKKDITD